jgi:hypothetical protein
MLAVRGVATTDEYVGAALFVRFGDILHQKAEELYNVRGNSRRRL